MFIIPVAVYLAIGLFRTQSATVDKVIFKKPNTTSKNEPLAHALLWPVGFFVAGK